MAEKLSTRIKRAWNAFNKDPTAPPVYNIGYGGGYRNDRLRLSRGNERSIINSVMNRIALDVAAISYEHVRLDDEGNYKETIDSSLNHCLTVEANIDQTSRAFIQDIVLSMFDDGSIAVVPVDTYGNPYDTGSYDIISMRRGQITEWYPEYVKLNVYNDRTGLIQPIMCKKSIVAIIENPMYSVMNEPNSTLQRLKRKLNLLDVVDDQNSSGKLDLIIQLPYVNKSTTRREQAELRRQEIEDQLVGSKYGIAYTDGTEHITQLNRPAENNLMSQVEYLTSMLYSQLGITTEILDGTAEESVMKNYYDRTVEPCASAIVDEMKRKFLTKTARSQKQSIYFFRDPFRLVPVSQMAEIADKMTRNEIMTSNEIRTRIGMRPSDNPEADELRNKNLNKSTEEMAAVPEQTEESKTEEIQNGQEV